MLLFHDNIIKLLLENGADPNDTTENFFIQGVLYNTFNGISFTDVVDRLESPFLENKFEELISLLKDFGLSVKSFGWTRWKFSETINSF